MFAYVKNGNVIAVSESRLQRHEPSELVEDESGEYWTDEVPGLVFDEEIETELEGELEFSEGSLRNVEAVPEPSAEPISES